MWQLKWEKKTRIDDDISTGRCSRFRVVAPVGEKSEWLIQKNVFSMERLSWRLFSVVAVASEHTHKISTLLRFQCVRLKIGLAILVQANAGFFIGRSLNGFPWVKYIKNVENSMTIHEWEMSSFVEPAVHSQSIFFFSRHKNRTTNWAKGRSSCHTWILCRAVIDFQIRDVPSMKWRCEFYSIFHEIDAIARFRLFSYATSRIKRKRRSDVVFFFWVLHVVIDLFELESVVCEIDEFIFRSKRVRMFFFLIKSVCFLVLWFSLLAIRSIFYCVALMFTNSSKMAIKQISIVVLLILRRTFRQTFVASATKWNWRRVL